MKKMLSRGRNIIIAPRARCQLLIAPIQIENAVVIRVTISRDVVTAVTLC